MIPMHDPECCGCCARSATVCDVRAPLPYWVNVCGLPALMCADCMLAWHEHGLTDPDAIKARVLAGDIRAKVTS